jgi:nicotinate-nucleotide adenylyltransferase
MRIGLFGGTFNPIHFGHLRPILEIKESFALDRVCFVPSSLPPHKAPVGIADAKDRYRMIELAIAEQADFMVSDAELDRPGPSYSIDTVCHFQSTLSEMDRLYLILGMDAFLEIDTWKSFEAFFDRVAFIVMNRPAERSPEYRLAGQTAEASLEAFVKDKISVKYRFSAGRSCYIHDEKKPIFTASVTGLNISATKIRDLIRQGRSIRYLVPEPVAEFIQTKGLYR